MADELPIIASNDVIGGRFSLVSLGHMLDRNRGLGPGFDFLRVFLALMVVFSHAFVVMGRQPEGEQSMFFVDYWVLAVFFSLSGFLITGSALRLKLSDFLKNRILRIVPALAVDIGLSALILGPLLTIVSLKLYFTNPAFFKYFFNIVGFPHYTLPGVFTDHPMPQVNISLWTVPWEISCYILMAALITLGLLNNLAMLIGLAVALALLGCIIVGLDNGVPFHLTIPHTVHYFLAQRGARLIICFLLGILAYQARARLPYSWVLFALCVLWCAGLSIFIKPYTVLASYPVLTVLAAVPLVYIMAFIGVSDLPKLPLFHRGDYSYGIYLYGFPIQQVIYKVFPGLGSPLLYFAVAVPFIVLFAMFSWHFIEKPVVRFRRNFSFVARQRLAEAPPSPQLAGTVHNRSLPVEDAP